VPNSIIHLRGFKGDQTKNGYSQWIWRQYASSVWMDIRIDNVLPHRSAKDDMDEKHVHPLQLDVIERTVVMWSNPGEMVLTPFMGVGSEVYQAVKMGRKAVGIELKESYYRQAKKNVEAATRDEGVQESALDFGDESEAEEATA
jgi:DNA modification methylase